MMTKEELATYVKKLNIPIQGIAIIERLGIPTPEPNVGWKKPSYEYGIWSEKMGRHSVGKRQLDVVAFKVREMDPNCFEFFHKPPRVKLIGLDSGYNYQPTVFVISREFCGWEEWQTEDTLKKARNGRYIKNESGWHCPAAESYAAEYGLGYRVICADDYSPYFIRNMGFLANFGRDDNLKDAKLQAIVRDCVRQKPGIPLAELLIPLGEAGIPVDIVYRMLLDGLLYTDLEAQVLSRHDFVYIFVDGVTSRAYNKLIASRSPIWFEAQQITLQVGTVVKIDRNDLTIVEIANHQYTFEKIDTDKTDTDKIVYSLEELRTMAVAGRILVNASTPAVLQPEEVALDLFRHADTDDLVEALMRYDALQLAEEGKDSAIKARTLRHWASNYRMAQASLGFGFLGLIDKNRNKGNHNQIAEDAKHLMDKYIKKVYETPEQMPKAAAYRDFKKDCIQQGISPIPSRKTFFEHCNKRDRVEQEGKRKGKRAAYQVSPPIPYEYLDRWTPSYGDYEWQVGHWDHTQLDLETIGLMTPDRISLGRPWLSILTLTKTRRVAAYILSYERPNVSTCYMLLRRNYSAVKSMAQGG